jgi:hypothetical protein
MLLLVCVLELVELHTSFHKLKVLHILRPDFLILVLPALLFFSKAPEPVIIV